MIHACILDGTDVLGLFPLAHVIGMETCYLTGVIFYLTRFPEKYYPERFDIWVSVAYLDLVRCMSLIDPGIKSSNFSHCGCGWPDGIHHRAETNGLTVRSCVSSDCIGVWICGEELYLQQNYRQKCYRWCGVGVNALSLGFGVHPSLRLHCRVSAVGCIRMRKEALFWGKRGSAEIRADMGRYTECKQAAIFHTAVLNCCEALRSDAVASV